MEFTLDADIRLQVSGSCKLSSNTPLPPLLPPPPSPQETLQQQQQAARTNFQEVTFRNSIESAAAQLRL